MAKRRKKKVSRRSSGKLSGWQRSLFRPRVENLEPRCMLTTLVEYTLVAADLNGDEAASINYGDNFYLDMYVQDTRTVKPDGVFAAYADLLYDDARVALNGAIQRGQEYPNVPSGNTSVAGLVDELGSVAGMNELGDSRFLLARLPMVATGSGTVEFSTNQADNLPSNDTLLYDANPSTVPPSQIAYGSTSMEILNPVFILDNGDPGFTATSGFNLYNQSGYQGDIHYANIGSLQTAAWNFNGLTRGEYQVWTNWTVASARPTDAPYTIKNVDGVQAVVPIDQKQAPDDLQDAGVAWESLGSYRVPDGDLTVELSNQASGKWVIADAVRIQKVADIPVAIDDAGSTTSDAAAVINVLLNDEPAAGTTMELTSVSSATNGTVANKQDDTATYTPGSSFVGTDTFTYVLTDSNGKTDVGQVTMTVTEPPPGSEAVDDAVHTTMITAITVPVLQNDTAAQGATLTVGTLGNPAHGAVIKNSDNTITYTPEAGFHGTDQFDYQLVDSLGETDSGQVTVSVTPVIQTRLQPSNAAGSLLTAVNAGDDFYLDVYIQDQRPQADGVFAAYFDVVMDTGLVSLDGSPVFGDSYPNTQHFTESAGQMEEIGAIGDVAFLGNAERLLFRLPVTAAGSGTADFSINPAENIGHEMLVYGSNSPVSTDTVVYDSTSVLIKEPVFIMDDGDNGFTASSGFYTWNQDGRDGDLRYADTGGNDTASWKFTQLAMGEYQAWATWTVASSRPSDASYTVSDADDVLGTVAINQKQSPNDLDSEGSHWESLGTYDIVDGTLEVGLSNSGSRWTIADAIRIEKIADIIPAPEIQVALGGTDVVDGSTLDLGSTVEGSAVTHTFTVKNSGTDTLTLSSIAGGSLPAGLTLASNLGELSLDPQETTTFAVTVTAADVATLGATIQIDNNDSDENPFDITLAAVVEALPQFQIMDDGDNGFTASSGFYTW
ncbi:MAG: Ig-like domain-containing protein, partial [Pirellulaceae bacterium]|nr:Ig-like domain-containing protein [Pirellulaceae bacterium]